MIRAEPHHGAAGLTKLQRGAAFVRSASAFQGPAFHRESRENTSRVSSNHSKAQKTVAQELAKCCRAGIA